MHKGGCTIADSCIHQACFNMQAVALPTHPFLFLDMVRPVLLLLFFVKSSRYLFIVDFFPARIQPCSVCYVHACPPHASNHRSPFTPTLPSVTTRTTRLDQTSARYLFHRLSSATVCFPNLTNKPSRFLCCLPIIISSFCIS